ncbi:MAG: hypothetical protein ACPGJS_00660 [Flammeovirgaceae bacterium]
MKNIFDSFAAKNSILCAVLLQVQNFDPSVSDVLGYVDKLGTIGLLIYFLVRDRKESQKREQKQEEEIDQIYQKHERDLEKQAALYKEHIDRIEQFYGRQRE